MPDNQQHVTGIRGTVAPAGRHANATSFKRGQSGNPKGRPKGSGRFRSGTRAAAALFEAHAEALAEQAIGLALAGDPVAVRFCLGRVLGARHGLPVALDLPALAGAADLAGAAAAIAAALNDGRVTPEEAARLAHMLDGFPRLLAAAPPPDGSREDPRERLIAKLDLLAATIPKAERRARLLEDLAALDDEPAPAGEPAAAAQEVGCEEGGR
ncbi:MAG TPA: DUF5681 domain-containing protein [Stellaceae bacterium]|jgi:hypothetical protein|nr:DUF5681 domain-containing protein [Stellaceae bacterium]